MTTYICETIPSKSGEKLRYFEFKQSMAGLRAGRFNVEEFAARMIE